MSEMLETACMLKTAS